MTKPNDLLDHVSRLIPAGDRTFEQLLERQRRREKNRKLAAGATVLAIWIALAAVVVISMSSKEASLPAEQPHRTPRPFEAFPTTESGVLPSVFPTDLPLPEGVRPVASRAKVNSVPAATTSDGHSVQVWFRSRSGPDTIRTFFEDSLPANGWSISYDEVQHGGVWDLHSEREGLEMIVLCKMGPRAGFLHHGSHMYQQPWDFYVVVTFLTEASPG
ncbi:MAG TPA: hypothetical protein VI341_04820 [Actinomycetota bacterium]